MTWNAEFIDLGMRAANLWVVKADTVGMKIVRNVLGDGSAEGERLKAGLQRILRTFRPELAGGELLHVRKLPDRLEFGYLHPNVPPVMAGNPVTELQLFPPLDEMRQKGVLLVRGVLDSLGAVRHVTQKWPAGLRNVKVDVAASSSDASQLVVNISADVPCGEKDQFARPAFPHVGKYERGLAVAFAVELWQCTLPEEDFVWLVRKMLATAVARAPEEPEVQPGLGMMGSVTIRYFADGTVDTDKAEMAAFNEWQRDKGKLVTITVGTAKQATAEERKHWDRLRLLLERHLKGLTRVLEGYEQSTHDSLCPHPRVQDVAVQFVEAYNSPTAYALRELCQRIQGWAKDADSRR